MICPPSYFAVWADTKRWGATHGCAPSFSTSLSVPLVVCDFVGVDDEGLAVVLGHDIQDDAGDDEQEPRDDQHHRADQRGEVGDHAGLGEFEGDGAAEHNADDADD